MYLAATLTFLIVVFVGATYRTNQSRRAGMTPAERAAEDRETEAFMNEW